ncbi:tRNA (guanosine(37)-N1)-methyltransferase TrmD [Clostridium formicaceticum]|uniref:tRNA (guanine-N(1)-)-methyltransferase n=1 Tax=Clostridium formicaceticum TaxID=1497 RepID=A0AAC9RM63_9CLOT|nr:tRNA (guanosine(37)-N1)-methyltransferase TrmD [Clostridium formicaceticum]AOY77336.1 tRNA (guanosine(37)-N1)-methyltransferase TrmD [Clostridium formicaceticum]ARE87880.1 tRNA (guanine-N(1)-)-methyltransferase [Clostridium formicaceticum]
MIIKVLTLFPEMFQGPLNVSIIKNAQEKGLLDIEYVNIRDFTSNKHKKVDDYPYGGGAGMVMTPQPLFDCYENTIKNLHSTSKPRTIYCSPKGKTFSQQMAIEMAKEKELVFICGHYEGIDQRVIDELVTDEVSIGDFVLTGGELPVAVMIDTIARLIPGVLGQKESFQEESFYSGLLEYPHYTRPKKFRNLEVPSVLFSGNHREIEGWRRRKSLEITLDRRPDLIKKAELTEEDIRIIEILKNHGD